MNRLTLACAVLMVLQPAVATRAVAQTPQGSVLDSLNDSTLGDSARAARLAAALPVAVKRDLPDGLATAERLMQRLDGMSRVVDVQKIIGHASLLRYYRANDNDAQIALHASRILALQAALDPQQRRQQVPSILLAYTALAAVYGDRAHADSAVALLRDGIVVLRDVADAKATLEPVLDRYAMVGHLGTPIRAQHWYNGGAGTTQFTPGATGTGHVTLIEFSAHWCGPCRKSYPALARLQHEYGAHGMQTLLATTTYGFFGKRQNLSPAEEAAADSAYYLGQDSLPVQLAVYEVRHPAQGEAADMPNETSYHVSGIPQLVLLDRVGVVRMVVVGWDPATEATLHRVIASLL